MMWRRSQPRRLVSGRQVAGQGSQAKRLPDWVMLAGFGAAVARTAQCVGPPVRRRPLLRLGRSFYGRLGRAAGASRMPASMYNLSFSVLWQACILHLKALR